SQLVEGLLPPGPPASPPAPTAPAAPRQSAPARRVGQYRARVPDQLFSATRCLIRSGTAALHGRRRALLSVPPNRASPDGPPNGSGWTGSAALCHLSRSTAAGRKGIARA